MPSVRYYDYGMMRRESDRRMLDAQQRRNEHQHTPMHRVTPDIGEQMRPAEGSLPIGSQDAKECKDNDIVQQECGCPMLEQDTENPICSEPHREKKGISLSGEELLIVALLILAISEGCELPLILALLYLLL